MLSNVQHSDGGVADDYRTAPYFRPVIHVPNSTRSAQQQNDNSEKRAFKHTWKSCITFYVLSEVELAPKSFLTPTVIASIQYLLEKSEFWWTHFTHTCMFSKVGGFRAWRILIFNAVWIKASEKVVGGSSCSCALVWVARCDLDFQTKFLVTCVWACFLSWRGTINTTNSVLWFTHRATTRKKNLSSLKSFQMESIVCYVTS